MVEDKLCKDNSVCCDDNCKRCANLIYSRYIEQNARFKEMQAKMSKYEVRDVVCDYGVYVDGELKLILNSRQIAGQIVSLLVEDERKHRELNPIKDYPSYLDCPKSQ